jgi:hypothetical protein
VTRYAGGEAVRCHGGVARLSWRPSAGSAALGPSSAAAAMQPNAAVSSRPPAYRLGSARFFEGRAAVAIGTSGVALRCVCGTARRAGQPAEDARFELARGYPQHAFQACAIGQLGESSVGESSDPRWLWRALDPSYAAARVRDDPSCGVTSPNPPGPEGSKGKRALAGVRGVPDFREG